MASTLNKVQLIGRLGKDPEMRFTGGGTAVTTFSIATNEYDGKDESGQAKERTEWHDLVVYGKLAEICSKYLAKGRQVYVEGRLQTRKWEDKESGQKRQKTEIVIRDMVMLGSREGGRDAAGRDQGHDQGRDQGRDERAPARSSSGGAPRPAPPGPARDNTNQDPGYPDEPPPEEDVPF